MWAQGSCVVFFFMLLQSAALEGRSAALSSCNLGRESPILALEKTNLWYKSEPLNAEKYILNWRCSFRLLSNRSVLRKAYHLKRVFSVGRQNNRVLGYLSNEAWAMRFCGEMSVNYLSKGTKTNVKDVMLLPNQVYKTNKQTWMFGTVDYAFESHRIWVWWFPALRRLPVSSWLSNPRCWSSVQQ